MDEARRPANSAWGTGPGKSQIFQSQRSEIDVNKEIAIHIDRWCERRDYKSLSALLPAWLGNNGLTDGWEDLYDALRHTYGACRELPTDEREMLKTLYVEVDVALRNR